MSETNDTTPPGERSLEEAWVDIRTLARVALESAGPVVMQRDLEMILTIAEMVLMGRGLET